MSLFQSILNVLRFHRRNWKAIVLCILTATVFWFFNALNKTYTANLSFLLSFNFDRENYVPVKDLPEMVRINVTGNGWDLFKRSTGVQSTPLEIPLERPSEVKKIVGSTLPLLFSHQLGDLRINFVLNDTLYIDLEPKGGKWVPLAVDTTTLDFKKGYGLTSDIAITPDSVFVEGPRRMVNKLEEPVKLKLTRRNIDEDFSEQVKIDFPDSDRIIKDPSAARVSFRVDKMVVMKDSVNIELKNVPSTVKSIQTMRIPITYAVPQRFTGQVNPDSLKAVLDLKGFMRGKAKYLPRVEGLPPYSKVLEMDSVRVIL